MARKTTMPPLPSGVRARIPTQQSGVRLSAVQDDMPALESGPSFRLIRGVANIVLVDPSGNPAEDFDPPVELEVDFTAEDVQAAGGDYRNLKLAFWKGGAWIVFEAKHQFQLVGDNAGGHGKVALGHWGDPPVGWGH